jgi:tetratricopeptide (TPR) repeat protein
MSLRRALVATLAVSLAASARASGGGGGPPPGAQSGEIQKAENLIQQKKWDEAIQILTKAGEQDRSNADIENWLGYAERNRGNLDAAFAHYDRALQLNPRHRGAHEYVGEAYLLAGKPDKAKEHLAALAKLCHSKCEEYEDLHEDVERYEKTHQSAAR